MTYYLKMNFENLTFDDYDRYLLNKNCKIIHQIWFSTGIQSKIASSKTLNLLKKFRDSWLNFNPNWYYKLWNQKESRDFIKKFYPEHLQLYDGYKFAIQKCDAVRYFLLHRYGGLYIDMDYVCCKSWDDVRIQYDKDIYLVKKPSGSVSNSMIGCFTKENPFMKFIFIELHQSKKQPLYYNKELTVLTSTGERMLNRVFCRQSKQVALYPFEKFHPFGVTSELKLLEDDPLGCRIYAYHIERRDWVSNRNFLSFLHSEFRLLTLLILLQICKVLI